MADETNYKVVKDFGGFGDGKWQKHLTLVSWFGREAVYDIRAWSPDMSPSNKGVTLTKEDLLELGDLINEVFSDES